MITITLITNLDTVIYIYSHQTRQYKSIKTVNTTWGCTIGSP